jgi:3-oxoacyl-[acyl-carrier-protein] synthase-1/3-oxoacyl-[acyl-carrier-protein] synthase II
MLEARPPLDERYGVIMAGLPAGCRETAEKQLTRLLTMSGYKGVVVDYRKYMGEFASASAVAAVLAVEMLMNGRLPAALGSGTAVTLGSKGILVAGFGDWLTAMEVMHP